MPAVNEACAMPDAERIARGPPDTQPKKVLAVRQRQRLAQRHCGRRHSERSERQRSQDHGDDGDNDHKDDCDDKDDDANDDDVTIVRVRARTRMRVCARACMHAERVRACVRA